MPTKPPHPVTFAERVRNIRKARGLTQVQLGVRMGLPEDVAQPRIARYENGIHVPEAQAAQALADALGVPLAYLVTPDERLAQAILAFAELPKDTQDTMLEILRGAVLEHRAKDKR